MVEPERNWRAAVGARRPEGKRDRCGRWRPVGAGKWDPHRPLARGSIAIQSRLPRTQRQEGSAAYATCGERTAATPKFAFEVFRAEGHAVIAPRRPTSPPVSNTWTFFTWVHSDKKQEGTAFLQPPPSCTIYKGEVVLEPGRKKKNHSNVCEYASPQDQRPTVGARRLEDQQDWVGGKAAVRDGAVAPQPWLRRAEQWSGSARATANGGAAERGGRPPERREQRDPDATPSRWLCGRLNRGCQTARGQARLVR